MRRTRAAPARARAARRRTTARAARDRPGRTSSANSGVAVLPERLVRVHARAVVAEDRLRHERCRLAGLACGVPDDVLVEHDLIRHPRERLEAKVDLALARCRDLVVVELARDAEPLERQHHPGAQVVQRVVRRGREVAVLLADRVAGADVARVPVALGRIDLVPRLVGTARVRDLVEDEELALRADEARVGDPGGAKVRLGALRKLARILVVRLARDRVDDLADERERRRLGEGVEDGGGGVRHQEHVALRDALPAADRGAVEAEPVLERVLVEAGDRKRDVLPRSRGGRRTSGRPSPRWSRETTREPRAARHRPRGSASIRSRSPSSGASSMRTGPTKKPQDARS